MSVLGGDNDDKNDNDDDDGYSGCSYISEIELGDRNNCDNNELIDSESVKDNRIITEILENSPARIVSSDGIIVDMENHFTHSDEIDLDLVIRDECDETHDSVETFERFRCSSTPATKKKDNRISQRTQSSSPYNYKRPSPVICAESIEIECLMHRAQFFLARACEENIKLAKKTSLWTTHPFIEKLLAEAYRRAPVVILVFLAKNAHHFAGFAKMCSEAQYKGQPAMRWVDFKGGGNIRLQWITKCSLALSATDHIKNPFNKEKVIYAAADGCEIQRAAGQRLCSLFPFDDKIDLNALRKEIGRKSRKSKTGLPSLLENEISYTEFRHAKRNLPVKKTIKDLCEERLPVFFLRERNRKYHGKEVCSISRPPPLMDVAVSYPTSNSARFSSSWRKRHASPQIHSWKRRSDIRDHRHRTRSPINERRYSSERHSARKFDSYSSHSSSKSSWHENSHERERHLRHTSRHRYRLD